MVLRRLRAEGVEAKTRVLVGDLAELGAGVEKDDAQAESDEVQDERKRALLFGPEEGGGEGENHHAAGKDEAWSATVGEASGGGSDHGPGGSDETEGTGYACAEIVVAVQEEGESCPEATERGKDQRTEGAGFAEKGL